MATEWKSQQCFDEGKYYLQFETHDRDKFKFMEKMAQTAIDGHSDRSIILPCKVGDTVYVDEDTWSRGVALCYNNCFIHSKYFIVGEIVSIIKTKKQLLIKIRVSNSIHTRYRHNRYPASAIGKTVFLTREEAEAKLKGE